MNAQPIIPWIGGKRRLIPQILPLFPEHQCYVELFAGAAAVFFNKKQVPCEVLNDFNGELVNLYRVVDRHLEEFVRQFKWALSSRQMFEWQKITRPETLTDIERAARFYYLQKHAFGAKVEGQTFGVSTTSGARLNLLRIEEELSAAHLRLNGVHIENLHWRACLERYDRPHSVMYADPPYWETEGYGVDFPLQEYDDLAQAARSMQGTLVISVNDHPEMRRVFSGLPQRLVDITYTVGGGGNSVDRQELIIGNWQGGWPAPQPLTQQEQIDW